MLESSSLAKRVSSFHPVENKHTEGKSQEWKYTSKEFLGQVIR